MKLLLESEKKEEYGILLSRLSVEHDLVVEDWMEMLPILDCTLLKKEKVDL